MAEKGLWEDNFINEDSTQEILDNIDNPKEVKKSKKSSSKLPLCDRLALINAEVLRVLGKDKDKIVVIKTQEELHKYIQSAIAVGRLGLDTETNKSVDPFTGKFVGWCIYTPGQKWAYIPINHCDLNGVRLDWQLTERQVYDELQFLLSSNLKLYLSNGKFDYMFIKKVGQRLFNEVYEIPVWWDTQIAARLLDENQKRIGLKYQYIKHCEPGQEYYSIEGLFEGVEYEYVDPEIFALYAAKDPYMSVTLADWQEQEFKNQHIDKVFRLFREVEMPVLQVTAEMELDGIELDEEYAKRLSEKYTKIADEQDREVYLELEKHRQEIDAWRISPDATNRPKKEITKESYLNNATKNSKDYICENGKYYKFGKSKGEQLEDPINLESPTQLAILLYDVLKCPVVNKKTPRSTDKKTLPLLEKQVPFVKIYLQGKKMKTLLNNFINKLPTMLGPDGRIHGKFNQLGNEEEGNEETVVTGRMSSSNPNLQQIPSKAKDIRMMFKASEGNVLVGADFSAQEPRILSMYSQDMKLINNFREGKDMYATIGTAVFKNDYWDNMEHYPDGSSNPEGKKRRSKCKVIYLGISYGMGPKTLSESVGCSFEEAKTIISDFFKGFPKVEQWMNETKAFAKKNGYVEDWFGRRRRLPELLLPPYEIKDMKAQGKFNPFLCCSDEVDSPLANKYLDMLNNAKDWRSRSKIKQQIADAGLTLVDNTGFISEAELQSVNARVQGGAATMTKIAMRNIFNDEEMRRLGFRLRLAVHDELIGECPKENEEACSKRLSYLMEHCIDDLFNVPNKPGFQCDADASEHWYYNDYCAELVKEYKGLLHDMSKEDAINNIYTNHTEMTHEQLDSILHL